MMQAETGKVRADAALEASPARPDQFLARPGADLLADEAPARTSRCCGSKKTKIVYRPFPVVGVISPWNFPLILSPATRSPR